MTIYNSIKRSIKGTNVSKVSMWVRIILMGMAILVLHYALGAVAVWMLFKAVVREIGFRESFMVYLSLSILVPMLHKFTRSKGSKDA